MTIAILIMAAGESSRFKAASNGQHKLLSYLPGSLLTVLEATYRKVLTAYSPDEILLVTNKKDISVAKLAEKLGSPTISIETDGLGTSIACAVKACTEDNILKSKELQGLFILPADMPFIASETLTLLKTKLTAALRESPPIAIRPIAEDRAGHPVGFSLPLFSDLLMLFGDDGAKSVLKNHPLKLISTLDSGILWDIDTPEDLAKIPSFTI